MISEHSRARAPRTRSAGFTLIEVMIAVLVMGVGLLGFALLQTMNVKFTKSAQERTLATNLAYELIDTMRAQRLLAARYSVIQYGTFDAVDVPTGGCERKIAATVDENISRWKCEVRDALPNGEAEVSVAGDGTVEVKMRWIDAHWEETGKQATEFAVESRL